MELVQILGILSETIVLVVWITCVAGVHYLSNWISAVLGTPKLIRWGLEFVLATAFGLQLLVLEKALVSHAVQALSG